MIESLKELTFKEIVDSAEYIRRQYLKSLSPFFNVPMIEKWRNTIMKLHFEYWKREKVYEYLNGDIELEDLIEISRR